MLPRCRLPTPPNDYLVSTNCSTTIREDVMKYLCLIYDEEKKVGSMSKSESDAFMGEYYAFTEGIQKSGHYVARGAVAAVGCARQSPGVARVGRPLQGHRRNAPARAVRRVARGDRPPI